MSWEIKKLNECCISIADGDHLPPPKSETGVPFVTIANVDSYNHFDFSDTMFVPQSYYDKLDDKRKARKGDILLTVVGSFGIPILITDDTPFVFQRHIAILRPNPAVVDSRFLYYTMMSKSFYAQADAYAIGAAQRTISLTSLRRMKIAVPDLETQRKIADTLAPFDSLIDSNNKQIKILEQITETIYKEWFVRFRFPGYETAEFEDGIPVGWEYKKINEMFDTSSGGTPSRSNPEYYDGGTIGWVKTGELLDTLIIDTEEHITSAGLQNSAAKLIPVGALLCSMYAGVGKLGITTKEITCSQATCVFMPKSYVSNIFMFHFLKLNKKYLENISFGAAQQNISQVIINKIKFLVPKKELVVEYDKRVENIYKQIYTIMLKNKNLIKQRDLLLPRLMSGKLEV